eukprot:TRINITY_DN96660_c0_g1_i1.p1 TRINITY_DN96660_c0_g1~~TRINITY_DN96660_c0_g1_i1.p1  ORF type:complete len:478 (+),score=108.15 TRINITY_DN96660_c0_g1_i1:23-1435(+)
MATTAETVPEDMLPEKRALDAEGEGSQQAKRSRIEDAAETLTQDDEFDELLGASGDLLAPPPVAAEETARRAFVDRLLAHGSSIEEALLPELLADVQTKAPAWGAIQHWRSSALLLACIARSSRTCRTAFVAHEDGLKLLGQVLRQAVAGLEGGDGKQRQEAGMLALACLACLKALPLGRATLWEHRQAIGKPFDQLHRWCGRERSALAAELRAPTQALCRRWRRQPKPAGQEAPEHKALRQRAVETIAQGLQGIASNSPASPAPLGAASPAALPGHLVAAEVETALWGRHGCAAGSAEYRQHVRMLRANLAHPGNTELRSKVLEGELSAEALVAMDSNMLAPEALQKQRREAELKAMRESIVEELIPRRGDSFGQPGGNRSSFDPSYDMNMAPRVWVASPTKEDEKPKEEIAGPQALHMEPPPTPFREGGGSMLTVQEVPPTPEMLATPAPEDEDEDEAALIRYLAAAP